MEQILGYTAILTAICYAGVIIQLWIRLGSTVFPLLPGLLYMTVWSIFGTSSLQLDFILITAWTLSFLLLMKQQLSLPAYADRAIIFWGIPALPVIAMMITPSLPAYMVMYLLLALTVLQLVVCEQVIRAFHGSIRALAIAIATLFLFQLVFVARIIATTEYSIELLGSRIMLNGVIALLLLAMPFYVNNERKSLRLIGISRPVAFTTTSIMIAGAVVMLISLVSLTLDTRLSEYRSILWPFLGFLAILLVGFNLGSSSQRARIRVWVNKHFFKTKYDYNKEWTSLSDRLSRASSDDFNAVALASTLAIYEASAGVIYNRQGNQFLPQATFPMNSTAGTVNLDDHPEFARKAAEEWIYIKGAPGDSINQSQELLPPELDRLGEALIVLPLIRNRDLIGLLAFVPGSIQLQQIDWEDLDLLKLVAKQVSNFVSLQLLAQEKAVKQQFEAYHQFTTFVMHDLKNLIAQQELVVQNASRFIDNPEFVADAIGTIEHSVQRMNRLIQKISSHSILEYENGKTQVTPVSEIIEGIKTKVCVRSPVPVFRIEDGNLSVVTSPETLIMAITHLVTNAQDACEKGGSVTVNVMQTTTRNSIIITIEDTGCGMDQNYLENRLFKPFDSTKKTTGMGIGAYQSREIINRIGGLVTVDSVLGEGTCFTITLPRAP